MTQSRPVKADSDGPSVVAGMDTRVPLEVPGSVQ